MRIALTMDRDVAVRLRNLSGERHLPLQTLVNEALRRGLVDAERPPAAEPAFRIEPWDLGRCLLPDLDSAADALARAEENRRR